MRPTPKPFKVVELWTSCELMYGVELVFTGEIFRRGLFQEEAEELEKNLNIKGLEAVLDLENSGELLEGSYLTAKRYFRNPSQWFKCSYCIDRGLG